jgi:hypothetical protein
MKKYIAYCAVLLALGVSSAAFAESCDMPKVKTSAALEKMKQLTGTWSGTGGDMGDGSVEVNYRITSGGTAVVETLFPGTEHEMTTLYYDEADKLTMTHYCMLGNHPVMQLTKSSDTELLFEANEKGPLQDQPHMNSLDINFLGPNAIKHKWSMIHPGKEGHTSVFTLKRKP